MQLKKIDIVIRGVSALLMNAFTDEAQIAASSGTRQAAVGDRGSPREQAEKKLYTDEKGNFIIPSPNLFRAIMDAGTFFKMGKSKVTTMKTSIIPSCVFMVDPYNILTTKDGWKTDTRPVRIPSTGGRIQCHRPCFDDWELPFTLELDESVMKESFLREIIDTAGSRIGLGDFRPACKGQFGRFKVLCWTAQEAEIPAQAAE